MIYTLGMSRFTPLEQARATMGFTARSVAKTIGLDPSGFIRIERGKWTPRQDTARTIEQFYAGVVPLGMCYDPKHPKYADWMTAAKEKRLLSRGRRLERDNPELRRLVRVVGR